MSQVRSICERTCSAICAAMLLALISVSPSLASAADDPFDRPGPYVGLSGVFQTNLFEDTLEDELQDAADAAAAPGPAPRLGLSVDDSGGLSLLAGYRLASFFALELQYEWVDEYDIDASSSAVPLPGQPNSGTVYTVSGHTLTANAKFIVPFWRIQPYLSIGGGLAVWEVDRGPVALAIETAAPGVDIKNGDQTDGAGRLGLGIDFYLTDHIVVNAQGQIVVTTLSKPDLGDVDDLNYVGFSAGLQYRF